MVKSETFLLCKINEFRSQILIQIKYQNHSENQFLSFCQKKPGAKLLRASNQIDMQRLNILVVRKVISSPFRKYFFRRFFRRVLYLPFPLLFLSLWHFVRRFRQ